jgi:lauroyl/myristoyl acyltransferase
MQRFSRKDVALVAKLPFSAALASVLPETRWDRVTDAIIRASALVDRSAVERAAALILRHVDPTELDEPVETIARRYLRNVRVDGLATLKSHDPRRWRAATRVEGLERIGAAQEQGRGVILWVAPFVFGALATKRALHEAGVTLHHLSTWMHGSSSRSRFGIRCISSIRVKAENRYLAERVVIPPGGSMHQPLRRLSALLNERAVVSITVGSMGAQPQTAPFLKGRIRVATGAPSLALRTGAVILPVVTARTAPTAFTTWIDPPLATDGPGNTDERRAAIVAALAGRLEPHARRWPDQVCWHHGLFGPRPQGRSAALPLEAE